MIKKIFPRCDKSGIALVTVMILVILLTIIAGALLSLQTSQVRLIEHTNRRTRTRYANEAVIVRELELLRKGQGIDSGGYTVDNMPMMIYFNASGDNALKVTRDYTPSF